MTSLISH